MAIEISDAASLRWPRSPQPGVAETHVKIDWWLEEDGRKDIK